MQQLFFIGLGGASGALIRFWLSQFVYFVFGRGFPYGTLVVNVLGSLCMGVLLEMALERSMLHENWRIALVIGFLGSFTTFSTFSADTLLLLHQGILFSCRTEYSIKRLALPGGDSAWFLPHPEPA